MDHPRALFESYEGQLEDFWGRRIAKPRFRRDFHIFGRPVTLTCNDEVVLSAVDHSLPLYSRAPETEHAPSAIQLAVMPPRFPPGPAPDDLIHQNWYAGDGEWLMITLGKWGHAYVNLERSEAVAILTTELALRPDLISSCLLDTVLLNFRLANGFGMLHASCLYRDGRALLLLAPHNTGKSTTTLRLAQAGFPMISDSMVFISPDHPSVELCGYPVGRVKLRSDVIDGFPDLRFYMRRGQVRDELKYTIDLEVINPKCVVSEAISPEVVDLCLLSRNEDGESRLEAATSEEVRHAIVMNSLYYDTWSVWQKNLEQLEKLLGISRGHKLSLGADNDGLVEAVTDLWSH